MRYDRIYGSLGVKRLRMNHAMISLVSEGLSIICMLGEFATSRNIMVSFPWFLAHCQFSVCAGHDTCSCFVIHVACLMMGRCPKMMISAGSRVDFNWCV